MRRLTREDIHQLAYLEWDRQTKRPDGPDVDEWIDMIAAAARYGAEAASLRASLARRHGRGRLPAREATESEMIQQLRRVDGVAIARRVARALGLSDWHVLIGKRGSVIVALARAYVAWILRDVRKLSYPEIGLALGGRDHSTAMAAVRRVEGLFVAQPELRAFLVRLAQPVRRGRAASAGEGGRVAA